MTHLTLVDQTGSEIELYLRKVLRSLGIDVTSLSGHNEQNVSNSARASNGVELRHNSRDVSATRQQLHFVGIYLGSD